MIADIVTTEWAPNDSPYEPAPAWETISTKVRTHNIRTGMNNARDVIGAGSMTVEVNNELLDGGWLDKNTWYRYRQIRAYCADATLFHGWIKRVTPDYGFRDGVSMARIEAVDAAGLLGELSTDADFVSYVDGAPIGEWTARTVENRAGYIGDGGAAAVVDWIISTTSVPFQGSFLPSLMRVFVEAKQSGNALQLLTDFLEAEQGRLAVGVPPSLVLLGRYADFALAALPSSGTFADDGTGFKWRLGSLVLAAPDETYIDDCTYGGVGIENQRERFTLIGYPPSTFVRTSQSPIADVNWAKANTEMIVELGRQTDTYPRSLRSLVAGPTATSYDPAHPAIAAPVNGSAVDVIFQGTTYKVVPMAAEHNIGQEGWWYTPTFRSLDRIISAYGASQVFTVGASSWGGPDIFGP